MKRLATLALLTTVGLALVATAAAASNAIAESTGLACTVCHDKPGSKLMTDRGKYFEAVGSLDGFEEIQARFSQCTDCHVKKPGSAKLTKVGERYRWVINDMQGLREWLLAEHPATLEPEAAMDDAAETDQR